MSTAAEALNPSTGDIASVEAPPLEVKPLLPMPVDVNIAKRAPQNDQLWWLLLVLAATLAILWLFVSVQLARPAFKRRAA
jgi:hypothetical protein